MTRDHLSVAWEALFMVALIAIAVAFGAVLYAYCRADGKPDYCIIGAMPGFGVEPTPSFELHVHRPWRSDAYEGAFRSHEEAVQAAERIGCPLR